MWEKKVFSQVVAARSNGRWRRGRANMVFTEVTIGPLGGLRDVVRLVPELLSAHVAPLLEVAGAV